MGGAVQVQDFPRPIIEHHLCPLDLASRQPSESRPLGKNWHSRPLVFSFVPRSQWQCGWTKYTRIFVSFVKRRGSRISGPWSYVSEGAVELNRQCPQFTRKSLAHEQVPLPMPRHRAIRHLCWSLVDADQVLDGPRAEPHLAGPTKPVPSAKIPDKRSLERAPWQHIERGIDGFARSAHRRLVRIPLRQPACNLFGRPALRPLLGRHCPIRHGRGVLASEFTRQGTRGSAQDLSNGSEARPSG